MDNLCIQNYRNEIDAHYGIPQVRRMKKIAGACSSVNNKIAISFLITKHFLITYC